MKGDSPLEAGKDREIQSLPGNTFLPPEGTQTSDTSKGSLDLYAVTFVAL